MENNLFKKLLEKTGRLYDYVILKKDEKGYYIEYAFCEGTPHDNRCLSWYYSYQEEAYIRNGWTEDLDEEEAKKYLKKIKESIDNKVGKLYSLSSFTCGGEENPEEQIERHKESHDKYHPDEPWVPESHVCKVGCPAKACTSVNHQTWTKEQPVKCACWHLHPEKLENIRFNLNIKDLEELIKDEK